MPPTVTDPNLLLRTSPAPRVAPKRPDPCADATPVCPACGGLQCLCRPRFFPGQLLTDEDLNRLERYVVEKNRLHARYLHGWGVACGLEVVCDPCTTTNVIVRTGYALSPCGDDIVVCKDYSVNVCELIDQCRPQTGVVCDPPYTQPPRECRDGTEPWVLAICYDERPTRGITALTGSTDTACCSSCACGGSGSCGCGGAAKASCASSSSPATTAKKKPAYQPQCEPTQICEGYRFIAYKQPPQTKTQLPGRFVAGNMDLVFAWMYANRAKFGPMLERLLCCVTAALEIQASFAERQYVRGVDAASAYASYLDALRDFASSFALHNCAYLEKLTPAWNADLAAVKGASRAEDFGANEAKIVVDAMQRLDTNLFDLIAECFCSALLPACPDPAPDNCVPLAVLTVSTRDCRVVEICNWEARKLLITWRTVGYWLSWLPWDRLRATIAKLCCADSPRRAVIWPLMLVIGTVLRQSRTQELRMASIDSEQPLNDAVASGNLVDHLAQGFERLRTGEDAAAPEWASLLARFADGSALSPLAGPAAAQKAQVDQLKGQLGIEELARQMSELQGTLKEYQANVDGLRQFILKGRGG